MKKAIQEKELYESPRCVTHHFIVRNVIALSQDENNPGGYVPGMGDGGNI